MEQNLAAIKGEAPSRQHRLALLAGSEPLGNAVDEPRVLRELAGNSRNPIVNRLAADWQQNSAMMGPPDERCLAGQDSYASLFCGWRVFDIWMRIQ